MSNPFIIIDGIGQFVYSPDPPKPDLLEDTEFPPVNDPDFENPDLLSDDSDPAFSQLINTLNRIIYDFDLDILRESNKEKKQFGVKRNPRVQNFNLTRENLSEWREVTIGQILRVQNRIASLSIEDLPQVLEEGKPIFTSLIKELSKYAKQEASKIQSIQPILQTIKTLSRAYTAVRNILAIVEKIKPLLNRASKLGLLWANPGMIGEIAQEILAEIQSEVLKKVLRVINGVKVKILNTKVRVPEVVARIIL